jgi:hypothetical protein
MDKQCFSQVFKDATDQEIRDAITFDKARTLGHEDFRALRYLAKHGGKTMAFVNIRRDLRLSFTQLFTIFNTLQDLHAIRWYQIEDSDLEEDAYQYAVADNVGVIYKCVAAYRHDLWQSKWAWLKSKP